MTGEPVITDEVMKIMWACEDLTGEGPTGRVRGPRTGQFPEKNLGIGVEK